MREKENNWERIEAVIKWANMTTNYFARYIGLARGENLYQIKRGNNGISFDVANRIVAKFPQIDKLWLLTGEGQMFADSRERGARIPFYDVDVEQGLAQLARLKSDEWLCLSFARPVESDFAMVYRGRAMGDSIPPRNGRSAQAHRPRSDYSRRRICDCKPKNCNFAHSTCRRAGGQAPPGGRQPRELRRHARRHERFGCRLSRERQVDNQLLSKICFQA